MANIEMTVAELSQLFRGAVEISDRNPKEELEVVREMEKSAPVLADLRRHLQSTLGGYHSRSRSSDAFSLPFIIPPKDQNATQTQARLTLDTGTKENWIRLQILERAQLQYETIDTNQRYVGATGNKITALGQVTITWYSENQSFTSETTFNVLEDLAVDVLLGSNWILDMNEFSSPVLLLKHIMTVGASC
jgi:hypothetical protein